MRIVLFCHPSFLGSQSMPRFAHMLKEAYVARGHAVVIWSPEAKCHKLVAGTWLGKWAGYIDQYLVFPLYVRRALQKLAPDTLFVFCDQALGPWVPMVKARPHIIHVHDLLALRSALGDIPENPTSITGRIYQRYIRQGFRRGRHFISVSEKTRADLERFGRIDPLTSAVVYNGLNFPYVEMERGRAAAALQAAGLPADDAGMLLHVGGSQWYKNQCGLFAMYAKYVAAATNPLPLWCIGPEPNSEMGKLALSKVGKNGRVSFFRNVSNLTLQAAYSYANAFVFPSLEEGFGWPLIEAQACGCAVITTNEPPMNEIAGDAAVFLPRLRFGADIDGWATKAANTLDILLSESDDMRARRKLAGRIWASRFDADRATQSYLEIYTAVLDLAPVQVASA